MARLASSLLPLLGITWLSTLAPSKASIPNSVRRAMSQMNSTESFLRNMIRPAADNETISEIGQLLEATIFNMTAEVATINDHGVEELAAMIAYDDSCSPRNMTVPAPTHGDLNIVYWPVCTRLPRCGGCCGDEMLECAPTRETVAGRKFLRARYPEYGSTQFIVEGWETIEFAVHLDCECRCRVQAHHCNPDIHVYFPDGCRCQCIDEDGPLQCDTEKIWDDHICECVCRHEYDCLDDEYFSREACRCLVMYPSPHRAEPTQPPTEPPIIIDIEDPCFGVECWPGYVPQVDGDSCSCVIPIGLPDDFSIPADDTNDRDRTDDRTDDRTPSRPGNSIPTDTGRGSPAGDRSPSRPGNSIPTNTRPGSRPNARPASRPTSGNRGNVMQNRGGRTHRDHHNQPVGDPIALRQPMVQGKQGHV